MRLYGIVSMESLLLALTGGMLAAEGVGGGGVFRTL